MSMIEIRALNAGDDDILRHVADGVFDLAVDPDLTAEFLADPRHHLVVAVDQGVVVGMVSGVHYVHPDKRPELWINELGVAPTHRQRGVGTALLRALLDVGRRLNCTEAWVLTDRANLTGIRTYQAVGGIPTAQDQVLFQFRLAM